MNSGRGRSVTVTSTRSYPDLDFSVSITGMAGMSYFGRMGTSIISRAGSGSSPGSAIVLTDDLTDVENPNSGTTSASTAVQRRRIGTRRPRGNTTRSTSSIRPSPITAAARAAELRATARNQLTQARASTVSPSRNTTATAAAQSSRPSGSVGSMASSANTNWRQNFDPRDFVFSDDELPEMPFEIATPEPRGQENVNPNANSGSSRNAGLSKNVTEAFTVSCPVCFDSLAEVKSRGISMMSGHCGHLVCKGCMDNLMKRGTTQIHCPTCRNVIKKAQLHPVFL